MFGFFTYKDHELEQAIAHHQTIHDVDPTNEDLAEFLNIPIIHVEKRLKKFFNRKN